ncbi:hypothetical protein [Halorientalis halophila]|uniref:hypothetical protein n=1 Tax=Halorientalis halophila TaxID=3108499 RepID=UPI00300B486D
MTSYLVRRGFQTVATESAGTTGTAKSEAAASIRETLLAAGDGSIETVSAEATDVYEFPSGPFDPYRLTVQGSVTVAVESADEQSGVASGERLIEELLTAADLDGWEYLDDATLAE